MMHCEKYSAIVLLLIVTCPDMLKKITETDTICCLFGTANGVKMKYNRFSTCEKKNDGDFA